LVEPTVKSLLGFPHSPTPSQNSVAVIDREREREREREKEGGLFTGLGFRVSSI
jgi:hypothetical protein